MKKDLPRSKIKLKLNRKYTIINQKTNRLITVSYMKHFFGWLYFFYCLGLDILVAKPLYIISLINLISILIWFGKAL